MIIMFPILGKTDKQLVLDAAPFFQSVSQLAVMDACAMLDLDCSEVSYPELTFTFFWDSTYGRFYPYPEEAHKVWLHVGLQPYLVAYLLGDRDERASLAYVVLLHETVHYLDYHVNGNMEDNLDNESVCQSERIAWSVENTWLIQNGFQPITSWLDMYPHCQA